MSYRHFIKHKSKYMYEIFEFTVPEITEIFKDTKAKWVKQENEERAERRQQLAGPLTQWGDKKTKKDISADLKRLKENGKDIRPVTEADYEEMAYGQSACVRIDIDKGTGKFGFQVRRPMSNIDILNGYNARRNRKEQGVKEEETTVELKGGNTIYMYDERD